MIVIYRNEQMMRNNLSVRLRKWIYCLQILTLILFTIYGWSYAEARDSQYTGEELSQLLRRYSGVTVEISPLRTHYIQGQNVLLHYRIECDKERACPWHPYEVSRNIQLSCNGSPVNQIVMSISGSGFPRDTGTVFEATFSAGSFFQEGSEERYGFRLLLPGHYVGYFDSGVMSADFEFDIEPIPDSLLSDWSCLCSIRKCLMRHVSTLSQATTDSVHTCTDYFISKPAYFPWRNEAIYYGLQYFSTRLNMRNIDSTYCIQLLQVFANEENAQVELIISSAQNNFKRLYPGGSDERLLRFSETTGRNDLIEAARKNWEESRKP